MTEPDTFRSLQQAFRRWREVLAGLAIAGTEASIRMSSGRFCSNRFLAAVNRSEIEWDDLIRLCQSINLGEAHLEPFRRSYEGANQIGFGFEGDESRVAFKLYFEFWDRLVKEIRANPKDKTPRPLHLGLKWSPAAPDQTIATTYQCFPLLPISRILDRLDEFSLPESVSIATARKMTHRLAPRLRNDSFIYLEAFEEATCRRSFDVNFYKAGCPVEVVLDLLDSARQSFGLPAAVEYFMRTISSSILGHVGGGQGRDGGDYLTMYYETNGLPEAIAM